MKNKRKTYYESVTTTLSLGNVSGGVFRTQSMVKVLCRNSKQLKAVNYFCRKAPYIWCGSKYASGILFSIQFTRTLLSSNKTTEVEYCLIHQPAIILKKSKQKILNKRSFNVCRWCFIFLLKLSLNPHKQKLCQLLHLIICKWVWNFWNKPNK